MTNLRQFSEVAYSVTATPLLCAKSSDGQSVPRATEEQLALLHLSNLLNLPESLLFLPMIGLRVIKDRHTHCFEATGNRTHPL